MERTANLKLPYIAPSQAQKHVTHNEAIRALDALVHLTAINRTTTTPPETNNEGDCYIISAPATGLWEYREGQIAAWQDGAWAFFAPLEGWTVWVENEKGFVVFHQKNWIRNEINTNPVSRLGVEATADDTNRLCVKSPASLFDHAGAGHQIKINKADDNQAASLLFQSNYQGRAEMGTMWGRDFRIKTSADGAKWFEAMVVDSATGLARFPTGIAHATTGKRQSGLILLPVWAGTPTIYEAATVPSTANILSVSANLINLNKNDATAIFAMSMRNAAMIRIWNVTRSPAQSAWVKWDTAADQLQVSNPEHIKQWLKNDVIRITDPVTNTIAIDISPFMQKAFGTVFAQDGVLLNTNLTGDMTLLCNEQSPVSSSNLVYFKGDEKRRFTVTGVYG